MRLSELFSPIFQSSALLPQREIAFLTEQASAATADSVFFCLCGARADGHDFAPTAYQNGCRVFVAEKKLPLPDDAFVLIVPNSREALGKLAAHFYAHPSRKLQIIGITGTKGKTTTAQMLYHIFLHAGISCGYIGTNGILFADVAEKTKNTTPDAITLQKTFVRMVDTGVKIVVMEVSSQAILQHRLTETRILCALFTNFSPDHVGHGEHPTLENYFECKKRLFFDYDATHIVLNADDEASVHIQNPSPSICHISCSMQKDADYRASDIIPQKLADRLGISFVLHHGAENAAFSLPLLGRMNVSNALLAIATANRVFDISIQTCKSALETLSVPGRCEVLPLPNGAWAVIDYAHNGVSLHRLLSSLRDYHPNRLICLFGSVGERSQLRRRELGSVAAQLCDLCFLTSDNPGKESPSEIIAEIAAAFEGSSTPYVAISDRKVAILSALQATTAGDILVLAGKGHEDYQLIGSEKQPFCEREIVLSGFPE